MTTPRDPLVVIAEQAEALRSLRPMVETLYAEAASKTEFRTMIADCGTLALKTIDTALSASAPMPAPERVVVEEVIRAMHSFEASCIVFGATTMGKNDRAIAECHSLMNDKRAALESAVRRLGGGQ